MPVDRGVVRGNRRVVAVDHQVKAQLCPADIQPINTLVEPALRGRQPAQQTDAQALPGLGGLMVGVNADTDAALALGHPEKVGGDREADLGVRHPDRLQRAAHKGFLSEGVPRPVGVNGRGSEDPVVVDGEWVGRWMPVHALQVRNGRPVGDEVAVDGEAGIAAGFVLPGLEQGALGEQVGVDVLGEFDDHMGAAGLRRTLLELQHPAVVEVKVFSGDGVGLAAGILEQPEEREEQRVVRCMAVRPEARLHGSPGPVDQPDMHREEGLAHRREQIMDGEVVDLIDRRRRWTVGACVVRRIHRSVRWPPGEPDPLGPLDRREPLPGQQGFERFERPPQNEDVGG